MVSVADRLHGMLTGIVLQDAEYDAKGLVVKSSKISVQLKYAETLFNFLKDNKYSNSVIGVYSHVWSEEHGPSDLKALFDKPKNFNEAYESMFGISFGEIFEDHPEKLKMRKTAIYQRAAILSMLPNLDPLMRDCWLTDPYVEIFEDVYTFTSILRLLYRGYTAEQILNSDINFDTITGEIMKAILQKQDFDLEYQPREVRTVIGAIHGAMNSFTGLMKFPEIRLSIPFIDSDLLDPAAIDAFANELVT